MKKLMIAAAIVCAAAISQAASVTWGSDALYNPSGAKVGNTATLYVYAIEASDYTGTKTAWELVGSDIQDGADGKLTSAKTGPMNNKFTSVTTPGGTPNTDYYYALVTTLGTGDDMVYIAEKVKLTMGEDGGAMYSKIASAATSAAGAKTAWQSASVPEPTSGLLLLLGVAGMALRRRRA